MHKILVQNQQLPVFQVPVTGPQIEHPDNFLAAGNR
jgi:hypothetical protein